MTSATAVPTLPYEALEEWERLPDGMTLHETPGVSVAPDGTVWLLTKNPKNPVIALDSDGNFLRTFGAGTFTDATHAILAAHDGYLYCADEGAHTITKWTTGGELLMTIGTPGRPAPKFSGQPFNSPTDIAIAEDGTIFISDGYGNARIHKYSPSGERLLSWGEPGVDAGQFLCPHNIGLRGDRLYVADREALRVQVFDLDGNHIATWNNIHRPCALTVGPEGNIYIGELCGVPLTVDAPGVGHRISVLSPDGELLGRYGAPEAGEGPGQFIAPHGIGVADNGDVYVGEMSFTMLGSRLDPPRELKSLKKLRRTG